MLVLHHVLILIVTKVPGIIVGVVTWWKMTQSGMMLKDMSSLDNLFTALSIDSFLIFAIFIHAS